MTAASDRQLTALSELAGLVAGGVTRRSQLATATGLSRAAVAQRVDLLIAKGLLVETGTVATERGRPPLTLQLASATAVVCAVDLGATHSTVAVADLGGTVLAEATEDLDINDGPEAVLTGLHKQLGRLLDTAGHPAAHVRAISIGLPGPVEASTGTVIRPPIMRGWDGYRVPSFFADRYPAPVLVDNDVNMMALGEYGHRPATAHLLYVKVGTGIGCGIVCHGEVYRGANGSAGDVGHICVDQSGPRCHCGNFGCVEAMAAAPAITRMATEAAQAGESPALAAVLQANGKLTAVDVGQASRNGDAAANAIIQRAGSLIGQMLASVVNFFNPSHVFIGGGVTQIGPLFLASVRQSVYHRSLALSTRHLEIQYTPLGGQAGLVGAGALAMQESLRLHGSRA